MNTRSYAKRKQRAGSAYVEALAVVSVFAILLALAASFGRGYLAQLLAGQSAREAAWTDGTVGCTQAAQDEFARVRELVSSAGRGDLTARLSALLHGAFQLAPAVVRQAAQAESPLPAGGPQSVTTRFPCNEAPPSPAELRALERDGASFMRALMAGEAP